MHRPDKKACDAQSQAICREISSGMRDQSPQMPGTATFWNRCGVATVLGG